MPSDRELARRVSAGWEVEYHDVEGDGLHVLTERAVDGLVDRIAAALATAREEGRREGYAEGYRDSEPDGMSWKEATTGIGGDR